VGLAFVTAVLGVVSISMGVAGFNKRALNPVLRIAAIVAGVMMVVPMVAPSIAGIVVFAGIYAVTCKAPAVLETAEASS
jgi:hypothetical protein